MTDKPEVPDRTPKDRSLETDGRRTPETEIGADGKAYDGKTIPVGEMNEAADGFTTDTFLRLGELRTERHILLEQLANAKRTSVAHRPLYMTKGDIHPTEWMRLSRLYRLIDERGKHEQLSLVAFSVLALMKSLTDRGHVDTELTMGAVLPAYGWRDEHIAKFNAAVAIVWTMAGKTDLETGEDLNQILRDLIAEVGLSIEEIMGE